MHSVNIILHQLRVFIIIIQIVTIYVANNTAANPGIIFGYKKLPDMVAKLLKYVIYFLVIS